MIGDSALRLTSAQDLEKINIEKIQKSYTFEHK